MVGHSQPVRAGRCASARRCTPALAAALVALGWLLPELGWGQERPLRWSRPGGVRQAQFLAPVEAGPRLGAAPNNESVEITGDEDIAAEPPPRAAAPPPPWQADSAELESEAAADELSRVDPSNEDHATDPELLPDLLSGDDEPPSELDPLTDPAARGDEPLYDDRSAFDAAVDEPYADSAGPEGGPLHPHHRTPLRNYWARQRTVAWPRFYQPLRGETWLGHPWSVSYFAGGMFGDVLIADTVDQTQGFFTGGRLGWDFDLHWGLEARVGYASLGLVTTPVAPGTDRSQTWLIDGSLLYYPFGDNRWRPYFLVGMGLADILYSDQNRSQLHETLFALPFGGGIKYRWSDRLVMRFEVLDNLAFAASKTDTVHNISISAGLEYRFGGPRRSYWPWEPKASYW